MRIRQIIVFLLLTTGQALAATQAKLVVQSGQSDITAVAISPDGKQVLTAGDRIAVLWDAATGNEIRSFSGHAGNVYCAAYSPSGTTILTAGSDKTARIWDPSTGQELQRFTSDSGINSCVFSPDGKQILTGDINDQVKLWDVASRTARLTLKIANEKRWVPKTPVAFTPDGRQILAAGQRNVVKLWDASTGQEIRQFVGNPQAQIRCLAVSPNGKYLATCDGTTNIWDIEAGKEIRSLAVSPYGKFLAAGSIGGSDATMHLWDVEEGKEVGQYQPKTALAVYAPGAVTFSPDSERLVTGHGESWGAAFSWDVASGKSLLILPERKEIAVPEWAERFPTGLSDARPGMHITEGNESQVVSIAFSADGRFLVTGCELGTAHLWDAASGKMLRTFRRNLAETPKSPSLAFSSDGRQFWTNGPRKWDLSTGAVEAPSGDQLGFSFDDNFLRSGPDTYGGDPVAVSPDGRSLAVSIDSTLYLCDLTASHAVKFTPLDSATYTVKGLGRDAQLPVHEHFRIETIQFSRDGSQILTVAHGSTEDQVRLWDVKKRKELYVFTSDLPKMKDVIRGVGGKLELRTQKDPQEISNGAAAGTLDSVVPWFGHSADRVAVFSPDGSQLLQASADRIVKLWDTRTGKLIASFEPLARPLKTGDPKDLDLALYNYNSREETVAVAFSPDGSRILLGNNDGDIRLFEKATKEEVWHAKTGFYYAVRTALFSADGSRIYLATSNRLIVLEASTGHEVARTTEDVASISALAQVPNQPYLISAHEDGTLRFWSAAEGQLRPIVTLVNLPSSSDLSRMSGYHSYGDHESFDDVEKKLSNPYNNGWAVVDPIGRFDTDSLDGNDTLHWVVSDDPFRPLPMEIFMRQYYTPKLLARLLSGKNLPAAPSIAALNRVQPSVSQPIVESEPNRPGMVRVRVKVTSQTDGKLSSGARDLRVFRDGRLVKFQEGPLKNGEYSFADIRLPQEQRAEFTAYAFNTDLVKSSTARTVWDTKEAPAKITPKVFLLNIGVDRNQATGCNLRYAAADAMSLANAFRARFPSVTEKLLVSDDARPRGATKEAIRAALADISRQATPDDVFIMSFSGHGYTDSTGHFYILPSDFSGSCAGVDESRLTSAISSDELAEWLRPLDAGEMTMILDACYSAASVESGGFKPGPMGSQGLGQLAYDKRIRILTASQSTQVAAENPWLGMGLLTYSLVNDGLQGKLADWQPKDGQIWLREWLRYGVVRVPTLYQALREGKVEEFRNAARGGKPPNRKTDYEHPSLQTPALFDFTGKENQGILMQ